MILFLIIPDTPQIPLIELSCVYKDNEKKNLMFLILFIIEEYNLINWIWNINETGHFFID